MSEAEKSENTLKNIEPKIIENLVKKVNEFYEEIKAKNDILTQDLFLESQNMEDEKF